MIDRFADPNAAQAELYAAFSNAVERRHEVFAAVGNAGTNAEAVQAVQELLGIPEELAASVLDLQLRRFTTDERERIAEVYDGLVEK